MAELDGWRCGAHRAAARKAARTDQGDGVLPHWRADGKELVYIVPSSPAKVMAVPVTLGATPQIGEPVKLFEVRAGPPSMTMYDISPDAQRFLVNSRLGDEPPPAPLFVVQHFDHELRDALEHHE